MSDLVPCRWRSHKPRPDGRWGCRSAKLVGTAGGVTAEFCATQCPFVDHAPPARNAPAATCIHLGAETGETIECQTCNGKISLPLFGCAVYGQCVQAKSQEAAHGCDGCQRKQTQRPALVVTADGIGDHLLGLAAATEHHATLVAKPWVLPWLELFDVRLSIERPPGVPLVCDVANRGKQHYAEAIRRFPAALPRLKPGVVANPQYAGAVVLAPFAKWAIREWPLARWLDLERRLLDAGRDVVVIGQDRLGQFAGETWTDRNPVDVAGLMLAASMVVGNDSGMSHLAGAMGCRALVLSAFLDGKNLHGCWPATKVIQAEAMEHITVSAVLEAMEAICSPAT